MKAISKIFILFFFVALSVSIFPQQWQLQNANVPANAQPGHFSTVNENVCWGDWTTAWWGAGYTNGVLRTTDSGITWSCDTIPEAENGASYWIEAINAATSYVAIEAWADWGMQGIYKTTDGGATWQKHPTAYANSDYGPAYIHFFDVNNGVVVGDKTATTAGFEIYTTTNAGVDWNEVPQSNIPPLYANEWVDDTVVGEWGDCIWLQSFPAPEHTPRIFKTTDKGYTWSVIDIPDATTQDKLTISFQSETTGMMIIFSPSRAIVEKTTDGGLTWSEVPEPYGCVPMNVSYVPGTTAAYVITGDAGFYGYSGGSAYTLDGGNTWTTLDNGNYLFLNFISDNVGWGTPWGTNEVYKYVGPPMPIPVELTSFTASVNGNYVSLNWATSTETNNKGFEVERSQKPAGGEVSPEGGPNVKSQMEWEKVGFVKGNGTTTEEQNYSFTDKEVPEGSHVYRLKQIDLNGAVNYSEEVNIEVKSVYTYYLNQNYPNPFNPTTTIKFGLKKKSNVRIDVFNSIGETVKTILNEERDPGNYTINFNAADLPSGVYIYRIESGNFLQTRKMILLR